MRLAKKIEELTFTLIIGGCATSLFGLVLWFTSLLFAGCACGRAG